MLLLLMGALTIAIGLAGPSMGESGWQASLTSTLDHWSSRLLALLGRVPGWMVAVLLIGAVTGLAVTALRQTASDGEADDDDSDPDDPADDDESHPVAVRPAPTLVEDERDAALASTR